MVACNARRDSSCSFATNTNVPNVVVGQEQSILAELLQQCLKLSVLKLDDLLLSMVDPAGENREQNVPGL